MEDRRWGAADGGGGWFDGFGDPGSLLKALADGGGDGIEVPFDGVSEAGGVIGYFLGVAFYVVGDGGELRRFRKVEGGKWGDGFTISSTKSWSSRGILNRLA